MLPVQKESIEQSIRRRQSVPLRGSLVNEPMKASRECDCAFEDVSAAPEVASEVESALPVGDSDVGFVVDFGGDSVAVVVVEADVETVVEFDDHFR